MLHEHERERAPCACDAENKSARKTLFASLFNAISLIGLRRPCDLSYGQKEHFR